MAATHNAGVRKAHAEIVLAQVGVGVEMDDVQIGMEGKELKIGFNPKFILDALRVIDDEEILIYFLNSKAPCFIRDEEQSYIYMVLPVNFV